MRILSASPQVPCAATAWISTLAPKGRAPAWKVNLAGAADRSGSLLSMAKVGLKPAHGWSHSSMHNPWEEETDG